MLDFTFGSGVKKRTLPRYDDTLELVNPDGHEFWVYLTRRGHYGNLPCAVFRFGERAYTYNLEILFCHSGDLGLDGAIPEHWVSMENLNAIFDWAERVVEPKVLKATYEAADEWDAL